MCNKLFSHCALVLLLALAPAAVMAQNSGPGAAKFREAEAARRANNLDNAVTLYREAIRLEGNNYRYYARLGMVLMKQNKNPEAREALENAARVNPGFTSAYVLLSRIAMKERDFAGAIRYINQAYDKEQDQAKKLQYKLLAVRLLIRTNQPQQAMADVQIARSLAPTDYRVALAEGDVQTALGNFPAALSAYNTALTQLPEGANPNDRGKVMLGRAVAMYKGGDQAGANSYAEQNLKPINARLFSAYRAQTTGPGQRYLVLARGYMSANMFTEAMENVNKAIESNSNLNVGYKMQGLIYMKQGQMQQALQSFTKSAEAETAQDKKASLYQMMVRLQFNAQMYREAVQTADQVLATATNVTNEGKAKIHLMKSQALYQLGQYQASIEASRAGMALVMGEPNQAVYQFMIGMAAKKAGNRDVAKGAFEKAKFGAFKYAAAAELATLTAP